MEGIKKARRARIRTMKPSQIIVLGFLAVILVGTGLLMLPVSCQTYHVTPFLDALFTSTSAVCVTGLVVVDTGTYWSVFGKTVILILIQIGGLGFMTMTTSLAIILGKKIGLRNRIIMQEALNQFSISGVIRLTKYVFFATMGIEAFGAALLAIKFIPAYGFKNGVFYSVFHAISAFCNAGFDIIGGFRSLMPFARDPLVNIVIIGLIVFGGLGFVVIADIFSFKRFRKMSLHSKLVLTATAALLLVAFICVFAFEYDNPATIGGFSFGDKVLASAFHAVTPRTAGFNTLDIASLTPPSRFLTMLLMFIGGSPGSTAGGVKTTTFALMVLYVISVMRGSEEINFAKRRIAKETFSRALSVILISTFILLSFLLVMTIAEPEEPFERVAFEAVSAFGTVGLSMGITPDLSTLGKIAITLLMFFGRLGPLTVVIAITKRGASHKDLLRYPEGKIIVG